MRAASLLRPDGAAAGVSDDQPTPRESGKWLFYSDLAGAIADRLDGVSLQKRKLQHAYDASGASRCDAIAAELRALRERFLKWPSLHIETRAIEYGELVPRLFELQREACELCGSVTPFPRRPS